MASTVATRELLMRNGVDPVVAKYRALNEFARCNINFLTGFWQRVKRPRLDFCPCRDKSPERRAGAKAANGDDDDADEVEYPGAFRFESWLDTVFMRNPRWIRTPRELMEQAVKEDKALCINKVGEWSLRTGGYMALSHVWAEGIQSDSEGRGFQLQQLSKIFHIIRRTGAEWIWTDVLAIPGGQGPTATAKDEILKINIINTMDRVYSRADAVIILDALVLQLHPQTGLDVAIALLCGKWMTRVWTYQEIKLANRALIVTAQGACYDYNELVEVLKTVSADSPHVHILYTSLSVLQRNDELGISLPDIVLACQVRKAGIDLDYVRAFFPALGLKWEQGMTREEGMQKIYNMHNQKYHASRIVLFHGCPRLSIRPAWAPSYFTGLEGVVGNGLVWEQRGLQGNWHVLKVRQILDNFTQFKKRIFDLEVDGGNQPMQVQCVLAENESDRTITGLEDAIKANIVYILSEQSSAEAIKRGVARTVLLVEQAWDVDGVNFEAFVYCTAAAPTPETYPEKLASVLLRHESPSTDDNIYGQLKEGGKLSSHLLRAIEVHENENPLHLAVREGKLESILELMKAGALMFARDSKDWTPLHTAAAKGRVEFLELLLFGTPGSKQWLANLMGEAEHKAHGFTLLSLAAEHGHLNIIRLLLFEKPDQLVLDNSLLTAAENHHADVVKELLSAGANVDFKDVLGCTPLFLHCKSGTNGLSVVTTQVLLDAGADVNAAHFDGATPLHKAAERGDEAEVFLLLDHGAVVDAQMKSDCRTPLQNAIMAHHEASVRLLLDYGADRNAVFDHGRTPVTLAAGCGNYMILQMILEKPVSLSVRLEVYGWTPLHIAAMKGERIMVRMLLEAGADVNAKDTEGLTPAQIAENHSYTEIAEILRKAEVT